MRLKFEEFPELFKSICRFAETKNQISYDEYKSVKIESTDSKQLVPPVLIFHIASFLGATMKDVNTINTNIRFIKAKSTLLIQLSAILQSETTFFLFHSKLHYMCQKLMEEITPINDSKRLKKAIDDQFISLHKNSLLKEITSPAKQSTMNKITQTLNACYVSL